MNSYTFDDIYEQFLTYVRSCTYADLTDEELDSINYKFLIRALAEFRFPQVSLDYTETVVEEKTIYTFTEITQREINVLLAYMRKYFLEWILTREKNFEQQYYDMTTRTFSQANLVAQMNAAYKTAIKEANDVNFDYTRQDDSKKPRIHLVNG